MNRNSKANIGELLLRQGIIDEDQLKHALSEQERTGIMLSKILVRLGMVSEDTLTNILGVQMQSTTKMRIGEMLMAQGYITEAQLDKALEQQKVTGQRLGKTLVSLGFMPEEKLIEILSIQFEIPYVSLSNFSFCPEGVEYFFVQVCRGGEESPFFFY